MTCAQEGVFRAKTIGVVVIVTHDATRMEILDRSVPEGIAIHIGNCGLSQLEYSITGIVGRPASAEETAIFCGHAVDCGLEIAASRLHCDVHPSLHLLRHCECCGTNSMMTIPTADCPLVADDMKLAVNTGDLRPQPSE